MFSQACVTSTPGGRGEVDNTNGQPPSSLPPPRGPGHNTSLPPGTRSQHLLSRDQATTPPSPGTRSQHLPPPWNQVTTPPSLPRDQVTTPPPPRARSQHLPPRTRSQHLHPPGLCAGGWYASYWNAFLFDEIFWKTHICHSGSKVPQREILILLFVLQGIIKLDTLGIVILLHIFLPLPNKGESVSSYF